MVEPQFAYMLFIKIYRAELLDTASHFIERQSITLDEKRALHVLTTSFVQFLATQQTFDDDELTYWVQVRSQSVVAQSELFVETLTYALEEQLHVTGYTYEQHVRSVHKSLVAKSKNIIKRWRVLQESEPLSEKWQHAMDLFSKALIRHNGSEDLAIVLKQMENSFQFKRCLFISYNPWLEEFSGAIGAEQHVLEKLSGKVYGEPIFSMKAALYLRNAAPYLQQDAIDALALAAIVILPITYNNQLYGWLLLDQQGEHFECSPAQLTSLQEAGNRLAMYIGRKQLRTRLNRSATLNEKERFVLHLLLEGYSNKEIAALLFLSEYTVRDYVQALMRKLHAKNRTHLITQAFRSGLVE